MRSPASGTTQPLLGLLNPDLALFSSKQKTPPPPPPPQPLIAGTFNYGGGNPMRPHRVRLTHSLVSHYDLEKSMVLHRPTPRSETQIEEFHADDYVKFLKAVTPDNQDEFLTQMRRFNMGSVGEADCPVFDGLFEYCSVRFFCVRGVVLECSERDERRGEEKNPFFFSPSFPDLPCLFHLSSFCSSSFDLLELYSIRSPMARSISSITHTHPKRTSTKLNHHSSTLAAQSAAPPCSTTRGRTCASTGPAGCTTPRRRKPRASATSTTSSWPFWSS